MNGSESFCARSIKPFGGSRRCLRRTRALWEFNDGKERRKGVPGLSRAAQPMVLCAGERIAAETWSEQKSGRSDLSGSKTRKCTAHQSTRSSRIGESGSCRSSDNRDLRGKARLLRRFRQDFLKSSRYNLVLTWLQHPNPHNDYVAASR